MKWIDGNEKSKYYAVCQVANDNGIMASKLYTIAQNFFHVSPIQCGNKQLKLYNKIILGKYDFFILANSKQDVENGKKIIEKIYKELKDNY